LLAEKMDLCDIHVNGDYKYSYNEEHYHHVAQRLVQFYDPQLKRCYAFGFERQPPFANPDVVLFRAYLEQAIRYAHPEIHIVYANPSEVRKFWNIQVKRTKQQSKASLNTKRLQNKRVSWLAPLMSAKNKTRVAKFFTKTEYVAKGKTKGKKKSVKCVDAWEATLIAVYVVYNLETLIADTHKQYKTRTPTSLPGVLRLSNIELLPPPQHVL
jgi:hypothetical protein